MSGLFLQARVADVNLVSVSTSVLHAALFHDVDLARGLDALFLADGAEADGSEGGALRSCTPADGMRQSMRRIVLSQLEECLSICLVRYRIIAYRTG